MCKSKLIYSNYPPLIDSCYFQIQKKNDVIRKLQSDMHTIEKLSEEFVRRTKAESEKQQQTDVKNHDGNNLYT